MTGTNAPLAPNDSFWMEAIDSQNLEPPLQGSHEADVVVVGGGYTGLVTAYFLKKLRPEMEVALLEAHYIGFGSSGRNAGIVVHEVHTDRVNELGSKKVRFTHEQANGAVDFIEQIADEAGFDCELERVDNFDMAFYPAHLRRIEKEWAECRKEGIELGRLGREEIQAAIHSPRFIGALVTPQAAVLHPGKYVAGLKKAVKQVGAHVYEKTPVNAIREGAEVEVVTPEGRLRARHVVLGLNAYNQASRLRVVRDRAVSLFSFIILTEPLSDDLWKEVGWSGRQCYSDLRRVSNYVRVTGNRILFGGRVLYHFGLSSPSGVEKIYGRLHQELLDTFPCLEGVSISHRWCGPVAISWRKTPLIGRAGKNGNIHYALGYSGLGVCLGTLGGRVLADLVLGEDRRWDDLVYLEDRMLPLPPEPFRFLGFQGSYYGMRLMDALDRWGGLT
jgi:glycine/D-amino acid oxidase-like deaminating enzyme